MKKLLQLGTFLLLTTCAVAPITAQVVTTSGETQLFAMREVDPPAGYEVSVEIQNRLAFSMLNVEIATFESPYGPIVFQYNPVPEQQFVDQMSDGVVLLSWPGELIPDIEEAIIPEHDKAVFNFRLTGTS